MNQTKEIVCPNCKSDNVANNRKPRTFISILLLFFAIPYPAFKNEYYCFDCELTFKFEDIKK